MSEHNTPASFVKEFLAAARAEVAYQWRLLVTPLPKPVEIPPNLKRIEAIPYSVLPDMSPARDALIALAWHGKDVDAYKPIGSDEWRIWCRPASPEMNGRYTIDEWKTVCDQELARLLPPGTW